MVRGTTMSIQNANRERAWVMVSLSPGIHLRRLQRLLGTSFSTTRYHVESLLHEGKIVSSREGRYQRLYPAGTADSSKAMLALLQSRPARRVLNALANSQGELRNSDLCRAVGMPRSTVSEYTSMLNRAGLVTRRITNEGYASYGVRDRQRTLFLVASFERNLLEIATDRFTDLWDL